MFDGEENSVLGFETECRSPLLAPTMDSSKTHKIMIFHSSHQKFPTSPPW